MSTTEWTFRDGKKFPAGKPHAKGRKPKMVMESKSSNGLTKYLTILWEDNVLTCDCRGWAILKKDRAGNPKPRTCKHCQRAAIGGHVHMTPVADFVPDSGMIDRPQLKLGGERQLRKIRIRERTED